MIGGYAELSSPTSHNGSKLYAKPLHTQTKYNNRAATRSMSF